VEGESAVAQVTGAGILPLATVGKADHAGPARAAEQAAQYVAGAWPRTAPLAVALAGLPRPDEQITVNDGFVGVGADKPITRGVGRVDLLPRPTLPHAVLAHAVVLADGLSAPDEVSDVDRVLEQFGERTLAPQRPAPGVGHPASP